MLDFSISRSGDWYFERDGDLVAVWPASLVAVIFRLGSRQSAITQLGISARRTDDPEFIEVIAKAEELQEEEDNR